MLPILLTGAAVILLLTGFLFFLGTPRQRRVLAVIAVLTLLAGGVWLLRQQDPATLTDLLPSFTPSEPAPTADTAAGSEPPAVLPAPNHAAGFVSSAACRECHPRQFASWHDTWHRTMTQAATPEAVVPSFDDVTLTSRGRTYHLFRQGQEFWVDTVDPAAEMAAFVATGGRPTDPSRLPRAKRRIVMTTGSHHHQTYWMQNANGTLIQFPWVYHINTDRWVYRIDSFLRPPEDTVTFNIWNTSCIACHSTGPEPRVDTASRTMHSAAELGIACEACHGPGATHVQQAQDQTGDPASSIAHPGQMSAEDSAKVCGQCHVISARKDEQQFLTSGDPYRPGNDQFDTLRQVMESMEDQALNRREFAHSIQTGFWPDQTVRTGGREYNGLILSRCYLDGSGSRQMSCLSCHSMHDYVSPNKLIARDKQGDQACLQCHTEDRYSTNLEQHTHHPVSSAGSRCVNCHMPHTSYALFSAIRSHRVQSPAVRSGQLGTRPNACNLCHLDQTKQWTAEKLQQWYQIETPPISGDDATLAAGALWALKGDAAQRATAAWHFRWDPALQASGTAWTIPVLADLLVDSYSAVRYMAWESLKVQTAAADAQAEQSDTGQGVTVKDLDYQFDGPASAREAVRQQILQRWQQDYQPPQDSQVARQTLLTDQGRDQTTVDRLLQEQDPRPISIVE